MTSGNGLHSNMSDGEDNFSWQKEFPGTRVGRTRRSALAMESGIARWDTILRWLIVILAFILACTEISNSEILLHIKCGEYTARQFQPARSGIYSFAAETLPWANLSWLFDLILFGIYALGSDVALSIFQGCLAAGVVFLVVGYRIPGVSTWWNVICSMLVALACTPEWNALPEIVTLLGLGFVLRFLFSWSQTGSQKTLWLMLPVFVCWSNLDPRVYLGLILVLLYAMGELLGILVRHPRAHTLKNQIPLWVAVGGCFLACLVNPFGWNSLVYPYRLYTVIDPTMTFNISEIVNERDVFHFTMMNLSVWKFAGWSFAASMFLFAISFVSFFLNRKNVRPGEWFSLLGFMGLALVAIRELPPAALVACLLGLKCAQQWYENSFCQSYSLKKSERLFSHGCRVCTAVTMLTMGFLAAGGLLGNERNRRIGVGFSYEIEQQIAGLQDILADSYDNRPFNFRRQQGDLLVWLGKKTFVDNRLALYVSHKDKNLLFTHTKIRNSVASSATSNHDRQDWQKPLETYNVTHVLLGMDSKLTDSSTDFRTYLALMDSPDWQLVKLGPSAAVFYRTDLQNPQLSRYLKSRRVRFLETAFNPKQNYSYVGRTWNRRRSSFERYFSKENMSMANETHMARHYFLQLQVADERRFLQRRSNDMSLAFALLTIRSADRGLLRQPRDPVGFYLLGNAYVFLEDAERRSGLLDPRFLTIVSDTKKQIVRNSINSFSLRRFLQSVHSLRQSLEIQPFYRPSLDSLSQLFFQNEKWDMAKETCAELLKISQKDSDRLEIRKKLDKIEEQIVLANNRVRSALKTATQTAMHKPPPLEEAKFWYREGMIQQAIRTLEQSSTVELDKQDTIDDSLLLAKLYLEAGWSQKTAKLLETLEFDGANSDSRERRNLQAYVDLFNAKYSKAAELWQKNYREYRNLQIHETLGLLFFQVRPFVWVDTDWTDWQTAKIHLSGKVLFDYSFHATFNLFQAALCRLEQGNMERAQKDFRTILKLEPETPFRQLIEKYLKLIRTQ